MKVLVFGYYQKKNLGDNLFADAFRFLFPELDFIFSDNFEEIDNVDAIFIGGGSFLYAPIELETTKPIFYLGVGSETDIDPSHLELMKMAKLIALRSDHKLIELQTINPSTILIPDLVYALPAEPIDTIDNKKVLILPNATLVPRQDDQYWMHNHWAHFKLEFAQFLDQLIEDGYSIRFAAMSKSHQLHDDGASWEIMNLMQHRNTNWILDHPFESIDDARKLFSHFQYVITQRFHGIVLSEMFGLPYLSIGHHDKMVAENGKSLSYYGVYKNQLLQSFPPPVFSIQSKTDCFLELQQNVRRELAVCCH